MSQTLIWKKSIIVSFNSAVRCILNNMLLAGHNQLVIAHLLICFWRHSFKSHYWVRIRKCWLVTSFHSLIYNVFFRPASVFCRLFTWDSTRPHRPLSLSPCYHLLSLYTIISERVIIKLIDEAATFNSDLTNNNLSTMLRITSDWSRIVHLSLLPTTYCSSSLSATLAVSIGSKMYVGAGVHSVSKVFSPGFSNFLTNE